MAVNEMWFLLFVMSVSVTNTIGIRRWLFRLRPVARSVSDSMCHDRVSMKMFKDTLEEENRLKQNPLVDYETIIAEFLFGSKVAEAEISDMENDKKIQRTQLEEYPTGNFMRSELFRNVTGVHNPMLEFMMPGQYHLKLMNDHMQTAVNAFSIFVAGNMADILRLPPKYVLNSARTIAMMKIAQEKLAATWTVVKAGKFNVEISHSLLEAYRPLFKYVNGREIAQLNLSDSRILKFIGTHPDLSRHQVGVVASKYIKQNPDWTSPKYLNQMNNLLCGVPMLHMRKLTPNTFLQLSHQVFYHIQSCDPIQRRFYLRMMTRTQALGRASSWSARDVARLGLLLAELSENELTAIKPQAMAGITPQVMMVIPPKNLKYISEAQIQYIDHRALNMMAKKLKAYKDLMGSNHKKIQPIPLLYNILIIFLPIKCSY